MLQAAFIDTTERLAYSICNQNPRDHPRGTYFSRKSTIAVTWAYASEGLRNAPAGADPSAPPSTLRTAVSTLLLVFSDTLRERRHAGPCQIRLWAEVNTDYL